MRPCISMRGSVRPSVRNTYLVASSHLYMRLCPPVHQSVTLFILIARKRAFSIIETARDCVRRREVIGSDEGAGKGVTREGAIRKEVKNLFFFCASEKRRVTAERTNGRTDRWTNTDRQTLLKSCLDASRFAKKRMKAFGAFTGGCDDKNVHFSKYFSMHRKFHIHPISLIFSKHDKSMTLHSIPFHEC